jgi:hypothetical protein
MRENEAALVGSRTLPNEKGGLDRFVLWGSIQAAQEFDDLLSVSKCGRASRSYFRQVDEKACGRHVGGDPQCLLHREQANSPRDRLIVAGVAKRTNVVVTPSRVYAPRKVEGLAAVASNSPL